MNAGSPADREQLKDIFIDALECAPAERRALLEQFTVLSGSDRLELERLLSLEEAESFFDSLGARIGSLAQSDYAFIPDDLVANRFRIVRFLAAGGMGQVYEALDLELETRVALKVLRPLLARDTVFVERFRREILLGRSIASPNVCRTYDVARHRAVGRPDIVFCTMELLEGETLAARIRRDGALPRPLADDVVRQLIGGLSAAHRAGVLHRDFKTPNVMLCQGAEGVRAIITDFGIARPLDDGSTEGDGLMTPSYASPEQLAHQRETPATDIFAFGAVLHEIATGKPAFLGPDRSAPPAPRRIRPDLDRRWEIVILRCLEQDPTRRFQNFDAVAAALEFRAAPSRRLLLAGAATAAAAVASGAKWWFRQQRTTDLPSLAVVPFETASENDRELAGALADRLTDLLARVPGLRVLSGERAAKPQGVAAVQHVLRGRLRDSTSRVEVHLELTSAATGEVSWSRTQSGDTLEIEGLYRDAVRSIVDALHLDQESAAAIPSSAGTGNAIAYQKYLLARYHSAQRDVPSVERSIALLEQAIALDDRFASAWAWLGMCYWLLTADDRPDGALLLSKADVAAMRALALNASEADAHTVIGLNNQYRDWNWEGAIWHFRRASALRPGDALAHHRYAAILSTLERHKEAIEEEDIAVRLDPDSSAIRIGQGMTLTYADRIPEAIAVLEAAAGADPGQANVYAPLSNAYVAAGRLNDALRAALEAVRRSGGKSFALDQEGYVRALMGQNSRARAILAELESRYRHGRADPYMVASVYAGWHDAASTLDWLERGVAVRDVGLSQLLIDRSLIFLYDTSRWKKLLETVGLNFYAK